MFKIILFSYSCKARKSPCVPFEYIRTPLACDVLKRNWIVSRDAEIGSLSKSNVTKLVPLKNKVSAL